MKNLLTRGLLLILCLSWFATAAQAFTTTTNYAFQLPQVNNAVDQNQWGAELNTNFSNLDSLLLTATNTVATNLTTTTTLTNANQNQLIKANATSAAFTINLQASATAGSGFRLTIKKTDSSANAVTILANSAELIDLSSSYVLTSQNQAVTLINDGTQWWVVVPVPPTVATATSSSQGIVQPDNSTITISGGTISAAIQAAASAGATGSFTVGAVRVQWGTGTSNPSGSVTSTFGTAFSGTPYYVEAQSQLGGALYAIACPPSTWTSTTFACVGGNGSGGSEAFNYAAIGPK